MAPPCITYSVTGCTTEQGRGRLWRQRNGYPPPLRNRSPLGVGFTFVRSACSFSMGPASPAASKAAAASSLRTPEATFFITTLATPIYKNRVVPLSREKRGEEIFSSPCDQTQREPYVQGLAMFVILVAGFSNKTCDERTFVCTKLGLGGGSVGSTSFVVPHVAGT